MSYPRIEQYNEVLQHPNLALIDPVLKRGTISTTGLGLPLAMCGGFALTYTLSVSGKKYALRCFHKESKNLEQRYNAISRQIKSLGSGYFLDFEFQRHGVRMLGNDFPIVKMAWGSGDTLATFVESNLRNKSALCNLASSLSALSGYLLKQNIAHGDIQPENVMVANIGSGIQLIDYDGMYVDELKSLGSAELGQINFQHPGRAATTWNPSLDRFAFITLNLSLRILQAEPDRWTKTQSDQSAILFRKGDYNDPQQSPLFQNLFLSSTFAQDAKNFAAICSAGIDKTPTLEDFIARRNIPVVEIKIISRLVPPAVRKYLSAYTVVDASDYASCYRQVGNQVELIGCIVEVRHASTKHGKPYVFINFGHWKNDIVKVNIWSEGLAGFKEVPSHDLVGKWVSVIGLMEPPFVNRRLGYSHLSITLLQANQMHVISGSEAHFRLSKSNGENVSQGGQSNRAVLGQIEGIRTGAGIRLPVQKPVSPNQAVLDQMRAKTTSIPASGSSGKSPVPGSVAQGTSRSSGPCFVATAAYADSNHPDVVLLRRFRDAHLSRYPLGRLFISLYKVVGPVLAGYACRCKRLRDASRAILSTIASGLRRVMD